MASPDEVTRSWIAGSEGHALSPALIERPGLRSLLLKALRRRLVLILAPSGYGKTLALRDAASHCGLPVVWLDMAGDIPSLGSMTHRIMVEASTMAGAEGMPSAGSNSPRDAPVHVISNLAHERFPAGLRVILDGVEHSPQRDQIVALALELLAATPASVGVALTATAMPATSLEAVARAGQLAVIGPERLAFTPHEVRAAVARWGSGVTDEVIAAVTHVTEGWPRGVMAMAAAFTTVPTAIDVRNPSGANVYRPTPGDLCLPSDSIDRELILSLSYLPSIEPGDAEVLTGVGGAHLRLRELARAGTLLVSRGADRYVIGEETRRQLMIARAAEWGPERVAEHWGVVGRVLEGRRDMEHALSSYIKARDGAGVSRALRTMGLATIIDWDPARLVPIARGLACLESASDEEGLLRSYLAVVGLVVGRPARTGLESCERSPAREPHTSALDALARSLPAEASHWPHVWEAWRLLDRGELRDAAPLVKNAAVAMKDSGERGFHLEWFMVCRGRLHCCRGEYPAARAVLNEVAADRDDSFLSLLRERWLAEVDTFEGDFVASARRARSVLDLSVRLHAVDSYRELLGLLALCAVWRGDFDEGRALIAQADADDVASARTAHARAILSRDTDAAARTLGANKDLTPGPDCCRPWAALNLGFLLLREGKVKAAQESFASVVAYAKTHGASHLRANALLCQAYAAKQQGDDDGSKGHLLGFWESVTAEGFRFIPVSDSDLVLWAGRAAQGWWPERRMTTRRLIAAAAESEPRAAADAAPVVIGVETLGQLRFRVATVEPQQQWKAARKAKRLLQLLLASPGLRVSLDEAADTLWPDGDPARVIHSLHNEASNLRRILVALGMQERLEVRAEHGFYRLYCSEDVQIQDRVFERTAKRGLAAVNEGRHDEARPLLENAVAMYGGPFLEDVRYEYFAEARRSRLAKMMGECLHALAQDPSTASEDAIGFWERALEVDPWDEDAYRGVVELSIQSGRMSTARHYMDEMTRKIVQELEVPVPEWAHAVERLMRE